ncbi:MAG: ABC transporter transmembrane domain-containing protein [Bacteroidales bacterium]|jgi:ABC-type multidrug transport system fused ATPase/permease subunit|nr:ABC transporter transmembrane domain-containing protein [Bacteroidales bacterium]
MKKSHYDVPKKKITLEGLENAFRLYGYMKPFRLQFIAGILFLIGSSLASLVFPKLLGELVNAGSEGRLAESLNLIAILIIITLLVQSFFSYFRVVLFVNVTEKTLALLRQTTFSHLIRLPLRYFDNHRVGELNSRISADIALLQDTLTYTLAEFIRQIIVITGGVTLLVLTSWKLTLFMLAVLPAAILLAVFFGRFIRSYARKVQKQIAESNTIVEESLQGIRSVKTYTNELYETARYRLRTNEAAATGIKGGKYRGAFSAFMITGIFGALVAVIWKGASMMAAGIINTGELFSFVIYSGFIGGTIGGLAGVFTQLQKFLGATEELFELLDEEPEKVDELPEIPEKEIITGNIGIRNLSFIYPSRPDEKVLDNINLEIPSNQMIAIVGPSGAGKTTITALLLGLYEPSAGAIEFDGRLSTSFSLSALRRQIALVPQDIFLFGGTIRENIGYGRPGATDREIAEAAEKANAMEFIDRFPDRFDTIVGERGTQLSGGQRQRIAIARAVLKNPRILILDEATSSLDSESERLVQDALEKLMNGRTSIVIAHRLSTVRRSDLIAVLDQGRIVETGTHEELIKIDGGIYRNLSAMQFLS